MELQQAEDDIGLFKKCQVRNATFVKNKIASVKAAWNSLVEALTPAPALAFA